MADINTSHLSYRDNVSCLVFKKDKFLLVQLIDRPKDFWKFPQGGIKPGEGEKEAVFRELKEELGTDKFKIVTKSSYFHQYAWDGDSIEKAGSKWKGQRQKFYLVEFLGEDKDIQINTQEVQDYKWVKRHELRQCFGQRHKLFTNYNLVIQKVLDECLNLKER